MGIVEAVFLIGNQPWVFHIRAWRLWRLSRFADLEEPVSSIVKQVVEILSLRQWKEICNGFIVELPIFIVKGTPVTAICCPCDEEFIEMIVVELPVRLEWRNEAHQAETSSQSQALPPTCLSYPAHEAM